LADGHPELSADALAHVGESASLLRVFVEDLLDITRIREQKLNMQMADVDLAEVIRSGCEITATAATDRDIQIALHLDLDPAPLRGDRVRLLQVIWNLLSNAIKFTSPGGAIDVRLEREGNDARLSVSDTGSGIDAEFVPHVFELYRQANETSGRQPGLGIGLSIVAQIVRLHGGSVRVASPGAGLGSTFIVTLPLLLAGLSSSEKSGRRSGGSRRKAPKS